MSTQPKKSCCDMRRKVVVGIAKILSEAECGVPDAVMVDYHDWDYQSKSNLPVAAALAFRFCPWCGTPRTSDQERRTVESIHFLPDEDDEAGEEWKQGQTNEE